MKREEKEEHRLRMFFEPYRSQVEHLIAEMLSEIDRLYNLYLYYDPEEEELGLAYACSLHGRKIILSSIDLRKSFHRRDAEYIEWVKSDAANYAWGYLYDKWKDIAYDIEEAQIDLYIDD